MPNAWVFSLLVSISLSLAAQSSEISVHDVKNGSKVIRIHGELEFRDEKEFTKKALELDEAIVFLEGPGGNLIAGIEIGKAIRLKGFPTVVLENNSCLSACALAWLGGQPRFATSTSKIGFHGAWENKGSGKEATAPGNALVGAYLHGLGLSDKAIWFATSAGPDEAEYLSFDRAEQLGIAVLDLTGAVKTAERTQPEAPPPPPLGGVYNDHTISNPRQNPPPLLCQKRTRPRCLPRAELCRLAHMLLACWT